MGTRMKSYEIQRQVLNFNDNVLKFNDNVLNFNDNVLKFSILNDSVLHRQCIEFHIYIEFHICIEFYIHNNVQIIS